MLHYNLTGTRFFDATGRLDLPNDAEMFAITAALLLYHDAAYGSLVQQTLVFDESDLAGVAECIEYRLPAVIPDIGEGIALRHRLRDFVGLAIGCVLPLADSASSPPT